MRAHLKPILALLVIAPFLTELLSNNLAPSVFFNPLIFVFLATIGYGFPILLLREFAIRWRMGIPGLICLGLAYGIINEGILAKTFYLAKDVPINTFDGYGYMGGIAIPWAILITCWHSVHAFLYPLLLTYFLFPSHRDQPWLNRKSTLWVAMPTILLSCLIFFTQSKERAPGHLSHFAIMLAVMGSLLWLATRLPKGACLEESQSFRIQPALWGALAFLTLFLVPTVLSSIKVPIAMFYTYIILVIAFAFRWLLKPRAIAFNTALVFAAGDEIALVLFAILGAIGQASIQKIVVDMAFLLTFALFIRQQKSLQPDARLRALSES